MTGRVVDPLGRTARVGAGVWWQTVLDAAAPYGLAPLCGSAPGVGVVGYLTGGGVGPLVRTVGLSSDHVRSFELVTGSGQVLRVTPEEHADLFWGLRGGKPVLGIVTAVEIDLLPIARVLLWRNLLRRRRCFRRVPRVATLDCRTAGLPEYANTSIAIQQLPPLPGIPEPLAGRMTVSLRYTALGDVAEAQRTLQPMRDVAPPLIDAVGVMPYAAIGAVHADPVGPMPTHEDHALLRELGVEACDEIFAACGPESGSPQTIVEVRLLGAEPRHRSASAIAPPPTRCRSSEVLVPPSGDAVVGHAAAPVDALAGWSTGGQMANSAPSADPARSARCYDEDALYWLTALANRYEPASVMR